MFRRPLTDGKASEISNSHCSKSPADLVRLSADRPNGLLAQDSKEGRPTTATMAQPRVGFSSGGSSGSSKKHLTAEPSSSTGPPPSPTPTARLEAAQHLLGCIAARHRNQLGRAGGGGCGGTGWWRALGQLRTAIRRLLVVQRKVLEQRPGRGQVRRRLGDVPKTKERPEERKRLAQKRRRRADDPVPVPGAQGDAVPGGGDAAVEVHARWLRDVLVPRCYA